MSAELQPSPACGGGTDREAVRVRARKTLSQVVSRTLTLTPLRAVFPLPQAGEG